MISKRKLSKTQQLTLIAIDAGEALSRLAPTLVAVGAAVVGISFIQKEVNKRVEAKCDPSLYVVIQHPTAVGPAFQCVSRAQLQGPAPALKQ